MFPIMFNKLCFSFCFIVDIDDCVNVTCLHGGSCIDFPNTFKCQCLQGYENIYCQSGLFKLL